MDRNVAFQTANDFLGREPTGYLVECAYDDKRDARWFTYQELADDLTKREIAALLTFGTVTRGAFTFTLRGAEHGGKK